MHRYLAVACSTLSLIGCCQGQLPQFELSTPPSLLGQTFNRMVCADVDGDGDPDVIAFTTLALFGNSLHLLLNDGAGGFVDVSATHMPTVVGGVNGMSVFDADGDGDLDVFATVANAASLLLRNTGGGTFVVGQQVSAAWSQTGSAAADFDGDGDIDVAVSGSALVSSRDRVLENDGTGTLSDVGLLAIPLSSSVVAGDVDLDGDPDLVFVDAGSGVRLFRNDGALQFTDISATNVVLAAGAQPASGFGLDLEGDGDLDLVMRGGINGSDFVVRNVAGTLTQDAMLVGASNDIALADVDGDGDVDLVRALFPTQFGLSINDGTGTFVDESARMPAQTTYSQFVELSDLDGDGDADLLSGLIGSSPLLLRNRDVDVEVEDAAIGQPWNCRLRSRPGYATGPAAMRLALALARLPLPVAVPPFGLLWLDLSGPHLLVDSVAPAPTGTALFSFAIPNGPALLGVELHVQGLVDRAPLPARLTAWRSVSLQ